MDNENLEGHWVIIQGKNNTFDNPLANISIQLATYSLTLPFIYIQSVLLPSCTKEVAET